MGTNYYLYEKPDCECCGRPFEPLHIGKSSGGWCFSLHVIPERGINTLDDWRAMWAKAGTVIRNEYGSIITPSEMGSVIADRGREPAWEAPWWNGYGSESEFHRINCSERGPNGLLRSQLGHHCVGHGEGTWDYISGEFS